MFKKYYVYRQYDFYDKVIYVGATSNLKARMSKHKSSSKHYEDVGSYDFAEVENKSLMNIYERYYINKHQPEYNTNCKKDDLSKLNLKELNFKYPINALEYFLNKVDCKRKIAIKEYNTLLKESIRLKTELVLINDYIISNQV